ncbi:MAG: hypothetical protein ABMA01_20555 [Chthoniobacteraceae bacterium]
MLNEDSIHYAMENTRVMVAPQNRIETFGTTVFRFFMVTELMDSVDRVRVRDGRLHAERPAIITPAHFQKMLAEDFGERAGEFMEWLQRNAPDFAVMRYGFQFRKTDVHESIVNSPVETVVARLREEVDRAEDPLTTVIHGVDEGWEVCLLKFAADMIQRSAAGNVDEWKRRGLL